MTVERIEALRRQRFTGHQIAHDWQRPHMSLGAKPPISRLGLSKDNLLSLHNEVMGVKARDPGRR